MRVLTVVLALAALPFAAGLAQGTDPFSDPKNCGAHLNFSDRAATRRADAALPHGGKHGVMDRPCGSPAPDPEPTLPACEVTALPVSGSLSIVGRVQDAGTLDASGTPVGLANWCIQLTDLSSLATATAVTDGSGNYVFPNLPDRTYLICEVFDVNLWEQTFPTIAQGGVPGVCPAGLGHSFPMWGFNASMVNFKNKKL